jgi:hypothetical protein
MGGQPLARQRVLNWFGGNRFLTVAAGNSRVDSARFTEPRLRLRGRARHILDVYHQPLMELSQSRLDLVQA